MKKLFSLLIYFILVVKLVFTQSVYELPPVDTIGAVNGDNIRIRIMSEPGGLNPILLSDAYGDEICSYLFESLNSIDPETYEQLPSLAGLPEVSSDGLTYTYSLNHSALFSDGMPITGEDVIFTMKAIKNTFVNDAALRNYYENVDKAELVNGDPFIVKIVMKEPYYFAIYLNGDFFILPKHILDPHGLTDKYDWNELSDVKIAEKNPSIKKFADFLNSENISYDPQYIIGSGIYTLHLWDNSDSLVLKRNDNYWNKNIPAYLNKIIYKVIPDNNDALIAAKSSEIDMMYVNNPTDFFVNFENPEKFSLVKGNPFEPGFSYLAWNELNPIFADKKVRWALSYLVDRRAIIDKVSFGAAVPVQSFIFFKNSKLYNSELTEIQYNLEKAKSLLEEAGWKDSDGDGTLDKIIKGKKIDFKFTFLNNTNPVRKEILREIIESLKKAGIKADVQNIEWSVFLEKIKNHEFDATYGAWQMSISYVDPYIIWHSSQAIGEGSNYISFINQESDKLIEQYRVELDESKRIELIKQWQKLIYDEQPYTFLWSANSRYIINNRFKNVRWYSKSPSYKLNELWVPKEQQKLK